MDGADFGENNRKYIVDFIKFGDAKAAFIITVFVGLCAILSASGSSFLQTIKRAPSPLVYLAIVFGSAIIVTGVMTVWYSLETVLPRTNEAAARSLASFPDIAKMKSEEYVLAVSVLQPSEISTEYARGVHALAVIALQKFQATTKAIRWLRLLLFSMLGVLAVYATGVIVT